MFGDVTSQLQGQELYDRWSQHLGIAELLSSVSEDLNSAGEGLQRIAEREQAESAKNLAEIATYFLPIALLLPILHSYLPNPPSAWLETPFLLGTMFLVVAGLLLHNGLRNWLQGQAGPRRPNVRRISKWLADRRQQVWGFTMLLGCAVVCVSSLRGCSLKQELALKEQERRDHSLAQAFKLSNQRFSAAQDKLTGTLTTARENLTTALEHQLQSLRGDAQRLSNQQLHVFKKLAEESSQAAEAARAEAGARQAAMAKIQQQIGQLSQTLQAVAKQLEEVPRQPAPSTPPETRDAE